MNGNEILIRDGRPEDSGFIAECILAGVGMWDFSGNADDGTVRFLKVMEHVCGDGDYLYSCRNARIAECGGMPVGCLVSYPGDGYPRLRETTWGTVHKLMGEDRSMDSDYETGPGEYYLDTLAVIPEFRGRMLGRRLLLDGVDKAHRLGYDRITLIVEQEHKKLIDYYESTSFIREGEISFLGDPYYKYVYAG